MRKPRRKNCLSRLPSEGDDNGDGHGDGGSDGDSDGDGCQAPYPNPALLQAALQDFLKFIFGPVLL